MERGGIKGVQIKVKGRKSLAYLIRKNHYIQLAKIIIVNPTQLTRKSKLN